MAGMEKDLVEASSSVLANPGSSCDPEMAEGVLSTSKQSRDVTDVSQKDQLLSDQQHETETDHDKRTTMGKHDHDKSVASGVVSSVVKPAQAKHPGAIPKKCSSQIPQSSDSKEANMQQTRKTAETFSNILTVGNSKKKDSSHGSVPLDSNARHDQVAHGVVYTQAQHPGTITKKGTSHPTQSLDCEESNMLATPMSAETFSNIVPVSDLEENVGGQEELTSKHIHMESIKPPPVPTWPPWSLPPPERDKKSEDMSANDDQVAHGVVYTSTVKPTQAQHPGTIPKKGTSHPTQSLDCEESIVLANPMSAETFSNIVPVSDLEKNVGSQEELTSKPIHVESTKPPPVPTWPPWSLPPPERDKKSEDMSANDDQGQDITMQSSISSHPPISTPEEGGNSSHDAASLVTGPQLLGTSATVVACVGSRSRRENLNREQSRNPAEHDDVVGNDGLLHELKKENEMLSLNASYLVQELRIQNQKLRTESMENLDLKQQLEASRAENVELVAQWDVLQQENEELRNNLNEREILLAENLQTIEMAHQLLLLKTEECDRLRERVPQPISEEED